MRQRSKSAARQAGLRHVDDGRIAGIRRVRRGQGFAYRKPRGGLVGKGEVARIKALAIPPAWTDVWICPWANGHLQATGRDARGRKQYLYHERWRTVRDGDKFDRLDTFGRALPAIRRRVRNDLRLPGLPRDKVLASVVHLLDSTLARVGNAEYSRDNGSFGLTTLRDRHARIHGDTISLRFRGKSGVPHVIDVTDRRIAQLVRRCQGLPGRDLFQYRDEQGVARRIGSAHVNDYLRSITGENFTAKDFRTWAGTVLAAREFARADSTLDATGRQRLVPAVIAEVARGLGNTPAVCRKCYIHPAVVQSFLQGDLAAKARPCGGNDPRLRAAERLILRLLGGPRRKLRRGPRRRAA